MDAQQTPLYQVHFIDSYALDINGKGDNTIWLKAPKLTSFIYPWNEGSPPSMSFQSLHNTKWLYGLYIVMDTKPIISYTDQNAKTDVLASDRVEIFLRKNKKMNPYYALELDSKGRIFDNEARYHRSFNQNWTWPQGELIVKTNAFSNGYSLEFAISKKSLRKLGLLNKNRIQAGLFRGECISLKGREAEFKWISWVRPDSPTPDFHIPSSFGVLILEGKNRAIF